MTWEDKNYTFLFVFTGVPEAPQNLREIEHLTKSSSLTFSWTPGEDGGETQYFDITFCPVGRSSKCIDRQQTLPNYTATNLSPYTKYRITLYSHNAVGYSNGFLSREGITLREFMPVICLHKNKLLLNRLVCVI